MAGEPDVIATIANLVSGAWSAANTNNVTPTFYVTTQQPAMLNYNLKTTYILFYGPSHITKPNDLGPDFSEETTDRISMDIRTKLSRDHLRNCYNECRRIVRANINSPGTGSQQVIPLSFQDFSTINFFRYVYDVQVKKWNQGD